MITHAHVKRILVPVNLTADFSVPLTQAIHFRRVYRSEIILLHVVKRFSLFHKVLDPGKPGLHHRIATMKLRRLADHYFKGEIPEDVKLKVVNGDLINTILNTARIMECDLIIIKKAQRIRKRFRKAENADRLIAEAICPVLTIMDRHTNEKIRNILIPVDIFKQTSNKIAWSRSLAKKFRAKLHIVSVLKMDINMRDSLAYKKSKKIEIAIRKEGIDVETVILKSDGRTADEMVLDYAAKLKPDMLLIMTHQESILFDNYLGTFATEIIHKSKVPVFSVVPRKENIVEMYVDASLRRVYQSVY